MRDGRWLIGWGMATATYPMNFAPASAHGAPPAGRHRRGDERGERHGAGHLDVDDAGRGRDARPAHRAGEVHARRHAAAEGAGAWRLDDDGERRQRRAGRLPQGARGRARARRRERPCGGHAPPRPAGRGLGRREAGRCRRSASPCMPSAPYSWKSPSTRISARRACGASSAPTAPAASSTRRRPAASASAA